MPPPRGPPAIWDDQAQPDHNLRGRFETAGTSLVVVAVYSIPGLALHEQVNENPGILGLSTRLTTLESRGGGGE